MTGIFTLNTFSEWQECVLLMNDRDFYTEHFKWMTGMFTLKKWVKIPRNNSVFYTIHMYKLQRKSTV